MITRGQGGNGAMCTEPNICEKNTHLGKRIAYLIISVCAILFFMLYLGPKMEEPLGLKPMADLIDERDIDSNMYFYTDVEVFSEAGVIMNNTMSYMPQSSPNTPPEPL